MKFNLLAASALLVLCGQANAATITLNPGESNPLNQQITCDTGGGFDPGPGPIQPPPPPPPPAPVPVFVGHYETGPNPGCIASITSNGNNGALGHAAEDCIVLNKGPNPSSCTGGTQHVVSRTDSGCVASVTAKANGPLNGGQRNAINKGCTATIGDCFMLQ